MANDDAIDKAYSDYRYVGEKGERETREAIQRVRRLSPEEYQKRENEGESERIAGRAAWEASTPAQREKIANYRIKRHGRRVSRRPT